MKRILIAEDEDSIRLLVKTTLESADSDIIEAPDGAIAYDKAVRMLPDLIILDWSMPGMTGVQVLEALQREPATAQIPVIMLTAMCDERDRRYALQLGACEYLVKPFSPLQLLTSVRDALERGERRTHGERRGVVVSIARAG